MSMIRPSILFAVVAVAAGIPRAAHAQGQPSITIGYIAPIGVNSLNRPTQTVWVTVNTQNIPTGAVIDISVVMKNNSNLASGSTSTTMSATIDTNYGSADKSMTVPAGVILRSSFDLGQSSLAGDGGQWNGFEQSDV